MGFLQIILPCEQPLDALSTIPRQQLELSRTVNNPFTRMAKHKIYYYNSILYAVTKLSSKVTKSSELIHSSSKKKLILVPVWPIPLFQPLQARLSSRVPPVLRPAQEPAVREAAVQSRRAEQPRRAGVQVRHLPL